MQIKIPKNLQTILDQAKLDFTSAKNEEHLYKFKIQYLGKKGSLSLLMKNLKNTPAQDRPALGSSMNYISTELHKIYEQQKKHLSAEALDKSIQKASMDLSLPGPYVPAGSTHPITQVINRITDIFRGLSYSIQTGPLVESDWYNFTALNLAPFHPSRDMQDTFYIDDNFVLRTHTSPVQIRVLESQQPPLAVLSPGRVFRCDSDLSHSPMFHQVEGLYVDKQVSFANLKAILAYFLKELFQSSKLKIRFRPSFFPFTEPSAEYDLSCPFCSDKSCSVCKKTGWIEIGGCGLVHPNVFRSVNLDSSVWQGFAFGLGVERLALILYNIPNIRLFFENDLRFLQQFKHV